MDEQLDPKMDALNAKAEVQEVSSPDNDDLVEAIIEEMDVTDQEPEADVPTEMIEDDVEEPREPDFKIFERGDFHMRCSCGFETQLAENVEGGMQYVIPATDKHTLDVMCPECNTKIQFYFTENTTANEEKDEEVLQESQTESEA